MTNTTDIALSRTRSILLPTPRGFFSHITRQLVRLFSADGRFAMAPRTSK